MLTRMYFNFRQMDLCTIFWVHPMIHVGQAAIHRHPSVQHVVTRFLANVPQNGFLMPQEICAALACTLDVHQKPTWVHHCDTLEVHQLSMKKKIRPSRQTQAGIGHSAPDVLPHATQNACGGMSNGVPIFVRGCSCNSRQQSEEGGQAGGAAYDGRHGSSCKCKCKCK